MSKKESYLGQFHTKIKHNREVVGKTLNLPLPVPNFRSTSKHLGNIRLRMAFTLLLIFSLKFYFEQIKFQKTVQSFSYSLVSQTLKLTRTSLGLKFLKIMVYNIK